MQPNAALTGDNELVTNDLGPLAWVLDELRKSLDGATKALRRFVRDAELARGSDLAALDASQLRIARQQLHQAVGALEMVGMAAPAKVLRAMEALAQRFVQRPELCSDDAANKVERASFALTEYLEGVLKGKVASAVALFPQYRDVLELVGDDRVHPADLWSLEWRWIDVVLPERVVPLDYDSSVRARIDQYVLKVVKSGDVAAAKAMRGISLGFAAGQSALEPRVFWKICAAYFEAVSLGLCPPDVYGKRAASRILLQYRTLARGEAGISERLVQDLLFFCAQAVPKAVADAPVLAAVRSAYGLTQTKSFDYETPQFGRFDPALLVQARKRIAAATETWSALAGGDTNRLKVATDQFSLVTDSVLKLHPEGGDLARAMTRAIEITARSGEAPTPALAMEVATAVLYLEAAYEDLDPTDSQMAERSASLAKRLEHVNAGGQPEPLEGWMEELYRRVSDRQIMGSVVDELRTTLGEIEKSLDSFFRNPLDKLPLHEVPSQLAQMRGVFSVLGLDQAALASLRMRDSVDKFLVDDIDAESARTGIFEKLGNSLGALGFLIDMLSYQRELAKKLFVYDEELGEFKPLMGREKTTTPAEPIATDQLAAVEMPVVEQEAAPAVEAAASAAVPAQEATSEVPAELPDEDERELKDIFLEEAREVVQTGLGAIKDLAVDATDLGQQTTLRRAFHTLKGSARMVGLNEFGEAAWSMEQLLNSWLAEQKPASDELIGLCGKTMHGFGRWVQDIADGDDSQWSAQVFRKAADGLRVDNTMVDLVFPGEELQVSTPQPESYPDFASTQTIDLGVDLPLAASVDEMPLDLDDFDFGDIAAVTESPVLAAIATDESESPQAEGAALVADAGEALPETPEEDTAADMETAADAVLDSVVDFDLPELASMEPAESEQANLVAAELEEQVKVIGSLRIGIPLYNVYLNEADEWSRRLLTELSEWALELHRPVSDTTVGLAHSLSGSSATVGFLALSEIARALEQALQHVQLHAQGIPEHAQVFVAAAEDIRRLLHQFAAGFLKQPDREILDALKGILETEFPAIAAGVAENVYVEPLVEFDLDQMPGAEVAQDSEPEVSIALTPITAAADAAPVETDVTTSVSAPSDAGVGPRHALIDDEDDDIDVLDALDVDLFPIFEEEALELLPQLGGALRQWTARPDNLGARNEVLRVLHTLKGSARLAGAMRLGEMTHRMESAIEYLGTEYLQSAQLESLLTRFDAIQANLDQLRASPEQSLSLPEAGPVVEQALSTAPTSEAEPASAEPIAAFAATVLPAVPALAPLRHISNQTVRVRSQLLDRMVNQAGEVMITRSRLDARLGQLRGSLAELTGNLNRLRGQLRDIELQSESQMQSRLAQAKDSAQGFDPLEFDRFTRVQELTRMMAESVHDVATVQRNLQRTVEGTEDDLIAQARQARELQRDLLRTRMVEFEGISERLYGVVRQASKDSGKQVKLDIKGGSLDMDRGVLDRMAPAFEHLLRNAVAHGIEDPAARIAAGKPAAGTITINLHQQSNDVTVEFSDDGAGLDLDRIRQKALTDGHISGQESLTDSEVANLIFTPGFSTASQVTELAGRGIGMDVVRAEINALGGRIETSTERGLGTKFKLVLPLTTAVTQVVMLRMGDLVIGVPANLIEMVRRVPAADLERAYRDDVFEFGGEQVPFYWAGALLQASVNSSETRTKTLPVAIFRSAGQRLAAHVDEVLGNQEVVVKNLGPQLSRLPGLAGMSVLASGAVVLIYNPVALASVYGEQARQLKLHAEQGAGASSSGTTPQPSLMASVGQAPLVLVVDDSITVRRVTQRLLKREGFRVALAADGLQALERLQEEKPAVVLTDIEMPRMDGFDLTRNIRGDAKLRDLPIIMITSRIAEKHREHARELGVDHYLGKPYSEDELIGLVRQYCAALVETAE
ncbi:MAG: Hpt domain-containing protein [Rhodoferax sp.]|uniref:hybrid sensor histidine kinase/response regulator n=1 Tax=Rhodoferax sp. TaxID=50421 RepID=UPI00271A7C7F|nr:Hpt domain-containing protein [Rhodoferax sp.]MDO8450120.1 Hpt domain-containing protein [Rhodoferax sp.]